MRELTKIHEEVIRTTLAEAAARYADGGARGEFVLVVEGAPKTAPTPETEQDAVAIAREYVAQGLSASEAAKRAASETGRRKSEIYREIARGEE